MRRSRKKSVFLLVVSIGLAVVALLLGPLGMTGKAQAAPTMILVTFTDTPTEYTDLSGNNPGTGVHVGELRCVGEVCNQMIEFKPLSTDPIVYEYKFKSRVAFDPQAERVIVTGTGIIDNGGPKTKFAFTGTFQNNRDGTIQVIYTASAPEASFVFPAAPGTFSSFGNN